MALSLEEYLKAKKEGRVKVGESVFKAAQSGLDSANDLVQRTQRQQSGQDKLWEREDIVKNLKSAKDYRNDALDVLTRFYSGDKKGAEYESLSKSAKENMKTVSDYLGKRNMATETTLENPNQWFDPERVRSNNAQGFVDSMTNNAFFENKNKAAANSTEMLENIAKDSGDLTERTWARQKKEAIEEQGKAQKTVGELRQDVERYKAAKNEMEGKPGSGRLIGELDSKIEETETRIRKKVLDDRETELEQKYGGLNYYQLKDVRNQKILSGDDEEWLNKKITEKASLDQLIEEHAEVVSQINALDKKSLANNPRAKHEGLDVKLRGDEEGASGDLKALRDRENELSELIADKKDEKLLNDVKKLTKTSDFEIYSKPDSKSEAAVNKIVSEGNAGNGADPLSIDQFTGKALADELAGFGEYANKYMTDDERKSIWYLYNTQGEEKAKEYYKALLRTLNKRMTQAVEQGNEEFVKNNGVGGAILATAKSVGTNLLSGAGIVEDIIKNVSGERLDTNSVYHLNTRRTSAIRGAVAGEIENPQLSWVYQTGMSVADSAVNMAVSTAIGTLFGGEAGGAAAGVAETVSQAKNAVSIISSIIMGSQVATQTVIEAKDRGLSDSQAVSLGVIYGAVEGLTEKYSIENILSDPSSIAGMLKKSFISEGSEEVAANIADRFADALISGDKSEQVLRAKELRKQGYSDSQVLMTIVSEALGDDALSFLGGALSGVAMTGAHLGVVAGKVKAAQGLYNLGEKLEERGAAKAEGEKLKSNESFDSARLIEQAKKSGDEKTVRLAEKLETQAAQGKTISNTNLGVLKTLTDSAFAQSKNEAKAEDNAQRQRIIDSEYSADGSEEIVKQSSRSTTNAFGNKYVKGLPVKEFTKEGKTHEVMMIYSSAREAGAADNTVLLQTKDGSLINAEGATVSGDSNYTKLLSMAGSFDTLGARGLLANFDRYAQRAGEKADVVEYVKSYKQLYDAGRTGATLESIENGGKYGYSIEALGRGVAYTAVTTGNHDSDLNFRAEDNRLQRMRIPGQKNALTSKVRVEEGVVPKASAEQIQILQALAEKAGREIVLTDKVKEGVNGFFDRRSGKIYLNAEIGDDAVLSVALHEVMHGVRLDAPTEFEAVRDFVFNYLESQGKNTERMIEVVLADWRGKISERDDAVEEIVCDTVMALASDEATARRAIESERNADRLLKLAEAIRKIAARVKQYIKDFAEGKRKKFAADGLDVGPIARETFLNDAEALEELADKFSRAADIARANMESYGEERSDEGENSNQIKSADAVTYDDAGKVIPLSQRFDSDEEDIRYSVDEGFYEEFDEWDGVNPNKTFVIGNTSDVLQSIGVKNQEIKMHSGMIISKLNKHSEMKREYFREIPKLIENPVIVQFSDGIDPETGKQKYDSRITVLGELYAKLNGRDNPVLVSLELLPTNQKRTALLDFSIVTSAYGHSKLNQYLKDNSILYIDPNKKRTNNWLSLNGLQLPVGENQRGSIRRITYSGGKIKIQNPIHETNLQRAMREAGLVDEYGNVVDDNSYSVQDEVYDYIAAEYNRENGTVDLDKLIRRNPSAAVQTLYRKALETAHRGLFKSRLKVSGVEIARIADSIFKRLHINKAGNIDAWDSLRADIRYFVERINRTPKGSEGNIDLFRNHFEYLSQQMADYVKLSEKYNDSTQKKARKKLEGFLGGRMLLLRPYEQVIIKKKFGSFGEFRSRLLGMTNVAYEKEGRRGYHIEDVVDFVKRNSPDMYNEELIMKDGGFEWLDILLNEYLEPSYHNEFHDQGYYEDALGRGVESAFEIMEQLIERNGAEQKNGAGTKANAYGRIENDYTEIDLIVDDNDDHEAHGLTALLNEFRETKMKAAQLETANKGLRRANTLNSEYMKRKLRSEYEERVIKNQYMSGIRRLTEHFRKMVMNPTNTSFLPPTLMQKPLLKAFEELGRAAVTREGTKTAEKMGEMVSTLNTLISGVDESKNQRFDLTGEYAEAFDKDFLDELARFEALLKGKTLTTADRAGREGMTVNEVREIYQIMQEIEHRLINARRQLLDKEGKTNSESAWSIFGEVEDTKTKLDKWKNRKAVKKASRFLTWTSSFLMNTKRVTRFLTGYNDDAELMKHWEKINKGQREMWQYMMEAEKHFKGLTERDKETKKAYEKSLREIVNVEFVDSKGDKQVVKMTRMQGLQIVMSWQREAMSGGEMIHLASQGIEIADPEQLIKGKVSFDNAQRVKFIDPQFITAIYGTLGSFEKEYMKAAETYFNEISKDAINEVMMVMKHREIANSEYYIPFEVDKNYVKSEPTNDATNGAIENRGSWEKTVKNQNPVLISSLNLIIDRHIKSTAELKGLAIPLRNFKRAYGMTLYDRYGRQHGSVRDNLTLKFGGESVKFFDQMIADLQGKRVDKKQNKRWKVAGNTLYKVNITRALVANVGVVIKQAASYPTAGRYLTGGNLTKGIGRFFKVRYKNIIKEIDEHTPLHYMRRIGMSEQEISDMMNNRITQRLPMTKWIEAMDCFTTAALWEATKAEVESRYRNQDGKIGSKEYWDEVTELYNTVIEDTQPMYDSLHRAEAQKGAGPLARAIFMFNTQPLQNTGILYDAALELVMKGDKRSWKNFGKAAASQIASMLTFTAMTWLRGMVLHKRKKYEDEEGNMTFASTAKAFGLDTLSSIVKLLAPYGGSEMYDFIVSWIEKKQYSGFDVGSISQLEDLVNKFNNTWKVVSMDGYSHNENWARFEAIKTLLGSVSEFFGIPYTNYNNIVMSVVGYGKDFFSGYPLTDNYGNFDDEHIAEYMVKAKIEGDSKRAEDLERIWKEELKKSGMNADESAKKIKDKLRAVLAENEDVKAAAQAELDGDTAAFDRAFEKVHSYGFDEKDVRSAVDKAKTAIKKQAGGGAEDAEPEEETDVDVFEDTKSVKPIKYQLSDGFEAIKRGDRDGYETVKSYLVENGYKTEEQIEKYMSSKSRTNKMWEEYLEAQYKGDNAEIKRLVKELTNVYGSWSKAKTGLEEYQNRKKNK